MEEKLKTPTAFHHKKYGQLKDAAKALGVNKKTIYDWMERYPDFPKPIKRGRTVFFDMSELENWLLAGKNEGNKSHESQ